MGSNPTQRQLGLMQILTMANSSPEEPSPQRNEVPQESDGLTFQDSHASVSDETQLLSQDSHVPVPEEMHELSPTETEEEEERQQWLKNVIDGLMMTEDVVVIMAQHRDLIGQNLAIASSNGVSEELAQSLISSLDMLIHYIDVIDNAVDFHKIGGFDLFYPLLEVQHPVVRAKTLELIADLVQNNVYCQDRAVEMDLLPKLFEVLEKDTDETVCVKALYAISCLCRQNKNVLTHLVKVDGIQKVLHTLQRQSTRIQTKAAFLLTNLINQLPEIRDVLFSLQAVKILVSLLEGEFQLSHEHILSALLSLVSQHEPSRNQCTSAELNLKERIMSYLSYVEDRPEFLEARSYMNSLLSYCDLGEVPDKEMEIEEQTE